MEAGDGFVDGSFSVTVAERGWGCLSVLSLLSSNRWKVLRAGQREAHGRGWSACYAALLLECVDVGRGSGLLEVACRFQRQGDTTRVSTVEEHRAVLCFRLVAIGLAFSCSSLRLVSNRLLR